jgi:hypothetical protein
MAWYTYETLYSTLSFQKRHNLWLENIDKHKEPRNIDLDIEKKLRESTSAILIHSELMLKIEQTDLPQKNKSCRTEHKK